MSQESVQAFSSLAVLHHRAQCPKLFASRGGHRQRIAVSPLSFRRFEQHHASVQAIIDATDDKTPNIAFGYAAAVVDGFSNNIQVSWLGRQGKPLHIQPMVVQSRFWFNENLESRNFIIPGLVAAIMALVARTLR